MKIAGHHWRVWLWALQDWIDPAGSASRFRRRFEAVRDQHIEAVRRFDEVLTQARYEMAEIDRALRRFR